MSNYEANPVGFLYERYQSSGVSPLYEVAMKRGQAHAPIFEAVLTVPEGHKVTAIGSSKKIAKNLAAKMMLDKLDGREEDMSTSTVFQNGDTNNNPVVEEESNCSSPTLSTLTSQPSAAASVANFYQKLQKSHGTILDNLHGGNICLGGDITKEDYVPVLEMLAHEQQFEVKFLQLESLEGVEQSLVQILTDGQPHAITVCLGMGPYSKNSAARCALMYIKLMSKPDSEQ